MMIRTLTAYAALVFSFDLARAQTPELLSPNPIGGGAIQAPTAEPAPAPVPNAAAAPRAAAKPKPRRQIGRAHV